MPPYYKKWLIGKRGNPNLAPSASIGYIEYLEKKLDKRDRHLQEMIKQNHDLKTEVERQKNLRRNGILA